MKRLVFVLSVFSVAVFLCCPITAFAITFDLSEATTDYRYQLEGVGLNVSATWQGGGSAAITQTSSGLGVRSVDRYGLDDDDKATLDGSEVLDGLVFAFDQQVYLTDITFSWVNSCDDFKLLVGTETVLKTAISSFSQLPERLLVSAFLLSAFDGDDSFRIKDITIETVSPVPTPEPATWLMVAAGLVGIACYRRNVTTD